MNVLGLEAVFSCRGYRVEYARIDGQLMQVNLAVDRRFTLKCLFCKAKMWFFAKFDDVFPAELSLNLFARNDLYR